MQKIIHYFFSDYHYRTQSSWFKRALYILLLIKTAYWLLYYDLLFGQHSIVYSAPRTFGNFKDLAFLLYDSNSINLSSYFIIGVGMFAVLAFIIPHAFFIIDFLLWLLVLNIHNKIYPTLTGGDFLLNQFLFFNCFLSYRFETKNELLSNLRMWLHNFAGLAVIIQVCMVYVISAFTKLGDGGWISGTAVGSVAMTDHFSMYSFLRYSVTFDLFYQFMTYMVLFYQVLFPVLIWFKKIKKPMLILGIVMHLYISFVMGLVSFGLVMIIGYVLFWPMKKEAGVLEDTSR